MNWQKCDKCGVFCNNAIEWEWCISRDNRHFVSENETKKLNKPKIHKEGCWYFCNVPTIGPIGWGLTMQDAYRHWERIKQRGVVK